MSDTSVLDYIVYARWADSFLLFLTKISCNHLLLVVTGYRALENAFLFVCS